MLLNGDATRPFSCEILDTPCQQETDRLAHRTLAGPVRPDQTNVAALWLHLELRDTAEPLTLSPSIRIDIFHLQYCLLKPAPPTEVILFGRVVDHVHDFLRDFGVVRDAVEKPTQDLTFQSISSPSVIYPPCYCPW